LLVGDAVRKTTGCIFNLPRNLACCRVSGDKQSSLVGAIMDKVMPATVTKISNLTKRLWQKDETSESNRPTEVSPQIFSRGKAYECRSFEFSSGWY
jgi:hypothetical protein